MSGTTHSNQETFKVFNKNEITNRVTFLYGQIMKRILSYHSNRRHRRTVRLDAT